MKFLGNIKLKLIQKAPEISLGAGIVLLIGSAVYGIYAGTKLKETVNADSERIEEVKTRPDDDENKTKDLALAKVDMGKDLIVLVGPVVALNGLGIALILYSYKVLKKREIALIGAYNALQEAYNEYRRRVYAKYGEDADKQLMLCSPENSMVEVHDLTENGEEGDQNDLPTFLPQYDNAPSVYAIMFDETTSTAFDRKWHRNPEWILSWLRLQEKEANIIFQRDGFLVLNDVYTKLLGYKTTPAGLVSGWWATKDGSTDNHISFGLDKLDPAWEASFKRGFEWSIPLDFNVDGIILDKIERYEA